MVVSSRNNFPMVSQVEERPPQNMKLKFFSLIYSFLALFKIIYEQSLPSYLLLFRSPISMTKVAQAVKAL